MLGLDQVVEGAFNLMDTGLSAHLNNKAMAKQYEYNSKLQEDAQAFQKEMRDTQYQSTVEDMQKAGINPAVALSGGASQSQASGGSSNSVSQGTIQASNVAGTMMQAKMQSAQIKNQTALTNADVALKGAEAIKTLKDAGYTEAQIKNATEEYNLIKANIENAKSQKELIQAQADLTKWEARHPVISKLIPAIPGAVAGLAGGIMAGGVGTAIGAGIMNKGKKPIGFNR